MSRTCSFQKLCPSKSLLIKIAVLFSVFTFSGHNAAITQNLENPELTELIDPGAEIEQYQIYQDGYHSAPLDKSTLSSLLKYDRFIHLITHFNSISESLYQTISKRTQSYVFNNLIHITLHIHSSNSDDYSPN